MANHNQNGGRNTAIPDDNRPSWRPQDSQPSSRGRNNDDDRDYRSWRERNYRDDERHADRDPRRWEGGRGSELGYSEDRDLGRSTERYGQGHSGYSVGFGEDRSQHRQNRNEVVPSPGSFEDRHHDLGVDDRFTGRGSAGYWEERTGYEPDRYSTQGGSGSGSGRGFEAAIGRGGQRGASEWRGRSPDRGGEWRSYDQSYDTRVGRGHESRGGYGDHGDHGMTGHHGGYDQRMGYQRSSGQGQSMGYPGGSDGRFGTQDDAQRSGGVEPHVHRGTGPHRGKGPQGYQRSDERIRELVCEALADDDQIDASQIQLAVKDGDVTLTGVVDDRRTRREAEDCVASVSGVRDVQVQLCVRDERQARSGQSTSVASMGSSGPGGSGRIETDQDKKPRA